MATPILNLVSAAERADLVRIDVTIADVLTAGVEPLATVLSEIDAGVEPVLGYVAQVWPGVILVEEGVDPEAEVEDHWFVGVGQDWLDYLVAHQGEARLTVRPYDARHPAQADVPF